MGVGIYFPTYLVILIISIEYIYLFYVAYLELNFIGSNFNFVFIF